MLCKHTRVHFHQTGKHQAKISRYTVKPWASCSCNNICYLFHHSSCVTFAFFVRAVLAVSMGAPSCAAEPDDSNLAAAASRRSRLRPFIFLKAISSTSCLGKYTRPYVSPSASTRVFFFLATGADRSASFSSSRTGGLCLRTVSVAEGPMSCNSTRGIFVPDFLNFITHCLKYTLPLFSATTTTRSSPFNDTCSTTSPLKRSIRMLLSARISGSVSNLSPWKMRHGLLPAAAATPAHPYSCIVLSSSTPSSSMSKAW
mmetsp:Transcript_45601/g.87203  ORF Transcript_45601/g.87203 Transcript_45601/m.87203 type:complete len:257 (+) Transcript_45601:94-864(+)